MLFMRRCARILCAARRGVEAACARVLQGSDCRQRCVANMLGWDTISRIVVVLYAFVFVECWRACLSSELFPCVRLVSELEKLLAQTFPNFPKHH